jgi:superoxide dismutase, Fe-Mn family
MECTRRDAIACLGALGTATAIGAGAFAGTGPERKKDIAGRAAGPAPGNHVPVALPFGPGQLKGISEKLIVSHHDNNYVGAVKSLNKVEQELTKTAADTAPFIVFGLRERELTYTNSIILHEHYFGNLGGDGQVAGEIRRGLDEAFGGLARWEQSFRAIGASLAGGSGWVVLDMNNHTGDLRMYWSSHHTQSVVFGTPLLVMDMYEHAYQMDYGADAARYVDAFFANINWERVNSRYESALKALQHSPA